MVSVAAAGVWPLAWIAPICWVWLVRLEKLSGRHPYRVLWLIGFLYWSAAYHWLGYPHWAAAVCWLVLSVICGLHLCLFVGLSPLAVHRLRIPLVIAAPVVWWDWITCRTDQLTGCVMATVGETQYRWTQLIQVSDLAGSHGISLIVVFAAAASSADDPHWSPAGRAVAGGTRRRGRDGGTPVRSSAMAGLPGTPEARFALIQDCVDVQTKADASPARGDSRAVYLGLSSRARQGLWAGGRDRLAGDHVLP